MPTRPLRAIDDFSSEPTDSWHGPEDGAASGQDEAHRILIIDGPASVRLSDVRGTNPVPVDSTGLIGDYNWSPAGDRLAIRRSCTACSDPRHRRLLRRKKILAAIGAAGIAMYSQQASSH